MKLLNIPEFLSHKNHNALAIFGCGYSINWITEEQWNILDRDYDTLGMNWYCKKHRPTTWYIVREQCTVPKRLAKNFELDDFYTDIESFRNAIKVVKDMSYRTNNYQHIRNLHKLDGAGYVFKEIQGGCSVKSFRDDIFDEGIHHGKCSIYDALHFAIGMKYEKIVLCGIDLYDNRYFYLPYDQTMEQTIREGNSVTAPHATAPKVVKLISDFIEFWKIPVLVQNRKSLLHGIIPLWDGI
jgi:hypothetical protein